MGVQTGAVGCGLGKEQLHREAPTPTVPRHQTHSPELPHSSRAGTPTQPHTTGVGSGMSRVGTEGLLGGLSVVFT